MDQSLRTHAVIRAITRITRRPEADVQPHLSLATLGLSASFGLSALRSQIEQAGGTRLPALRVQMTVSEVIALLDGGAPAPASRVAQAAPPLVAGPLVADLADAPLPASLAGIGLGMDLQEIDSFPLVTDYRADSFYAAHFDASEIATGLLRPDTRAHLCGVFCAKEAAKKSAPALLDLRMTSFRVSHDAAGRPMLAVLDAALAARFGFVISITHTERTAAATCLTFGGQLGA